MTGKRFDYEYNHNVLTYILTDNGEEITSFDAEGVSDEDIKIIINLLNEQEELIKRLKTIREEQTETILKQKRKIRELEEENKQLQIEVLGQSEEIEILSDENKRLKQGKYVYGIRGGSNDRK